MKAKRIFLANVEEHRQHQELGLNKKPEVKVVELEYYFELRLVTESFVTSDGYINIMIQNREVLLSFDKKVWEKIKSHLE